MMEALLAMHGKFEKGDKRAKRRTHIDILFSFLRSRGCIGLPSTCGLVTIHFASPGY